MKYMLKLYGDDARWNGLTDDEWKAEYDASGAFSRWLSEEEIRTITTDVLEDAASARTVQPGQDTPIVTDGPYVELKEHIAGYFVIEALDLDQAVEAAKHRPLGTGIEVRAIGQAPS